MMRNLQIFILLLIVTTACSSYDQISSNLDSIEDIMDENPKEAKKILESIENPLELPKRIRARYSLLYSIALDKNYIDLTSDSIIAPAVEYYTKKGSGLEKLKTFYYLGRIYKNAKDYNRAIVEYSKAEQIVPEAGMCKTAGLLYMSMADIYNHTRNSVKEIEYAKKGYEVFKEYGNETDCNLSFGTLAFAYTNLNEWNTADSLFNKAITLCVNDSIAMPLFLTNYARLKVLSPDKDPKGAISLLNKKYYDYGVSLSVKDYCAYAYA